MMLEKIDGDLSSHESWKYILREIENETILFKTKLAQVLSGNFERKHLVHLEVFQYRFLKMDEQISLLRYEVRDFQEALLYRSMQDPESTITMQEILAGKMELIKNSFNALSSDFKMYLQEHFL